MMSSCAGTEGKTGEGEKNRGRLVDRVGRATNLGASRLISGTKRTYWVQRLWEVGGSGPEVPTANLSEKKGTPSNLVKDERN